MRKKSWREPPFKVGGEVEPPFFVGREDEIQRLSMDAKTLAQSHVILAPRRYGKTSLLHNVKLKAEAESEVILPEINCREMANLRDFSHLTIGAILRTYEERHRVRGLFSSFERVLKDTVLEAFKAIEEIGGSLEDIGEVCLKFREKTSDERELVRATFDFIHAFSEEKKAYFVIIYDEFQKTVDFDSLLYEFFKSSMDRQERVRYFFSGSSLGLLEKVFLREDSPLYLMVGKHLMGSLSEETTSQFVIDRFGAYDMVLDEGGPELFFQLTGGIPYYIQKLGLICFQNAFLSRRKRITKDEVLLGFERMLAELDGEFESRLAARFTDQQRRIIRAFARSETMRMSEIAGAMGSRSSNISTTIARLVDAMILSKDRKGCYKLTDEVFRRWLGRGGVL